MTARSRKSHHRIFPSQIVEREVGRSAFISDPERIPDYENLLEHMATETDEDVDLLCWSPQHGRDG